MAFCSFSSEVVKNENISVPQAFISDFLPILPEHCLKVYLFGLYNCHAHHKIDNSMEAFVAKLNLSEADIESCFAYLAELGLVQIVKTNPIQVLYLPVSKTSASLLKFNKDKYKHFNTEIQNLLFKRVITPTEYNEYYYTMESLHIEPDAMLMIAKYCADLKGNDVGYKYITTVAKNWAYDGITTAEKVEERIACQEASQSDVKLVLSALGYKRTPTIEDYQLYLTWKELGFDVSLLVFLASKVKKHNNKLERLDFLVNKFYKMRLTSQKEIEEYLQSEEELYNIAKEVCKNIGIRYENLEIVIETYIIKWVQYGFDFETLSFISKHCFMQHIRTLEGIDNKIEQFYKLGLISLTSIEEHLQSIKQMDQAISKILEQLQINRNVNKFDREYYNTWIYDWEISEELLNYAISQSVDKIQPMQFLNKLLSVYHNKRITTVEQAKNEKIEFLNNTYTNTKPKEQKNKRAHQREYTKEQLESLFTSQEEVEI